jgi:DNA primase
MDIVEQIKQVANIVDIASLYTTLRQRGRNHVGLCPFHSEKDPSFTVDQDKQFFHCFGCGQGGDVFTLVMEKENMSFPEAVEFLANRYNITLPEKRKLSHRQLKEEEQLARIMDSALAFFQSNLSRGQEGKKALAYLQERKVSQSVARELKLGYAPNTWDGLLNYFQSKGIPVKQLERAGLVLQRQNRTGHYDRFRGRLIFPIFTGTGKVVAFGGRTITGDDPKYLNSPDTPLYTKGQILYGLNFSKEAIRKAGAAILVEGYTDYLSLYQAGIRNLVASLGTALTPRQVSLVSRFVDSLIICYDGDDAGVKASTRAVTICMEKGVQSRVVVLPAGQDPDSYLNTKGVDALKKLMDKSLPGLKFYIGTLLPKDKAASPEIRSRIAHQVVGLLDKVSDPLLRSEYIRQTGEYLDLEEQILRSLVQHKADKQGGSRRTSFLTAEKRLLQMIFDDSGIAGRVFQVFNADHVRGLRSEPIFLYLADYFRNNKEPDFNTFKNNIDPELFRDLSAVLMEGGPPSSLEDAEDCLTALKDHALLKRWNDLDKKIRRLEKEGDEAQVRNLLKERQQITEELSQDNYS